MIDRFDNTRSETQVAAICNLFPKSEKLNVGNNDSMSGASFVLVPEFYVGTDYASFSPNAVFKIFPSGIVPSQELLMIRKQQDLLGSQYKDIFWPYTVSEFEGIQLLVTPQFDTTVSDMFRQASPPAMDDIKSVVEATAATLTKLGNAYREPVTPNVEEELALSLIFTANVLDSQIDKTSKYSGLPQLLKVVAGQSSKFAPKEATLSGNDCWLGNVVFQNGIARIFDPLPNLPLLKELGFSRFLDSQQFTPPSLRSVFLDWSRVSVSLNRSIYEWRRKNWQTEANFLEKKLAEFRNKSEAEIGKATFSYGELLNNAYFVTCNCESCRESGALELSLSETERIAQKLLEYE